MKTEDIEQYITDIVLPAYLPMVTQNIHSSLFGIDGKQILTTDYHARSWGYKDRGHTEGGHVRDSTPHGLIKERLGDDLESALILLKLAERIMQIVVLEKRPISAVLILPYHNSPGYNATLLVTYMPIFAPDGDVVATQTIITDFSMFGMTEFVTKLNKLPLSNQLKLSNANDLPIKLTVRQHEILFLLLNGVSQHGIAEALMIKRGNVGKVIRLSLYPKFNIIGGNAKLLLKKAKELNFHHFIPPSLCKPRAIILDTAAVEKYELNSYLES